MRWDVTPASECEEGDRQTAVQTLCGERWAGEGSETELQTSRAIRGVTRRSTWGMGFEGETRQIENRSRNRTRWRDLRRDDYGRRRFDSAGMDGDGKGGV
jgi:hypothetical protein